jgi:hypothetical protein
MALAVGGKAIARNEHGKPGEFDLSMEQGRKVLKLGRYRDPSRTPYGKE